MCYPTAIGSEPLDPNYDSQKQWHNVMKGHAAANMVPVIASNRTGTECLLAGEMGGKVQRHITFYGSSFITNNSGDILDQMDRTSEGICIGEFDIEKQRRSRTAWGLFRDRRPDMYKPLANMR